MARSQGLVSVLHGNSVGPCEATAFASTYDTSAWERTPKLEGTLTRCPSSPTMAEPLARKERDERNRPRTFYPHTAFLCGTRPFSWKGAGGQTVSLFRGRVPKPTCSILRTDVPVQWQFLPLSKARGLLATYVERQSLQSLKLRKDSSCSGQRSLCFTPYPCWAAWRIAANSSSVLPRFSTNATAPAACARARVRASS